MPAKSRRKLNHLAIPLANAVMRGVSMVGRFTLSIYLAKYLDFQSLGLFGLLSGIVGYAPAALGCGLNYFLSREVIDMPPAKAGRLVRDRLAYTLAALAVVSLVAAALAGVGLIAVPSDPLPMLVIIVGEVVAFDIHMALIGLRMPVFANILLFVRSALWVFPFAGLGLFFPRLRQIDILFDFWIGALALNYLCLFWHLRDWPWKAIAACGVDWRWMVANLKKARLIYVSDLGLAGLTYVDRFIISSLLGLEALGMYVFYWQIANAVQVLTESAVVQVALPRLFTAHRHQGEQAWRMAFFQEIRKVAAMGVALSVAIYVFVAFVMPYLKLKELHGNGLLFPMMLAGAVLRLLAGIANTGLVSRGLDTIWALSNIGGILLTIACGIAGIYILQLDGVALAVVVSAAALAGAKFFFVIRDHRRCHFLAEPPRIP